MNPAVESVLVDTAAGKPAVPRKTAPRKAKVKIKSSSWGMKKRPAKKTDATPPNLVQIGKSLVYDPAKRSQAVIEFIETHCGLKLAPFQLDFIEDLYRTDAETGRLVRSRAIYSTGRKCGKTSLAGALVLAHCVGSEAQTRDSWDPKTMLHTNMQARDRIIVVANSKEQAKLTFSAAQKMVEDDKILKGHVDCVESTLRIVHRNRLHVVEFLGHNPRTAQGNEPQAWFYDELGSSRDSRLLEALDLSQGTVVDPVGVVVSTNSDLPGQPLFDLCDTIRKGQQQGLHKEWVLHVHAAGPKDDPWKKKSILKANPAIGHFAHWDYYKKQRDLAKKMPSRRAAYEAFVLNRRYGVKDSLVNVFDWQACADQSLDLMDYEGKECWIGLDLSMRKSMTAAAIYFPPEDRDGNHVFFSFCWLPADGLADLQELHRTPYLSWAEQGLLLTTEGKTLDLEPVLETLEMLNECFDVKSIRMDQHRNPEFEKLCREKEVELPLEQFSQRALSIGPAAERFTNLIAAGKLRHDDSPAANFCVANTLAIPKVVSGEPVVVPGRVLLGSSAANYLPNDACVAMINAVAVTQLEEEKPKGPIVLDAEEMMAKFASPETR